jgi:hypothetical protein
MPVNECRQEFHDSPLMKEYLVENGHIVCGTCGTYVPIGNRPVMWIGHIEARGHRYGRFLIGGDKMTCPECGRLMQSLDVPCRVPASGGHELSKKKHDDQSNSDTGG